MLIYNSITKYRYKKYNNLNKSINEGENEIINQQNKITDKEGKRE
jgi:hypothetical protein